MRRDGLLLASRLGRVLALAVLASGCSGRVPLNAPWSHLGNLLYIELTDAYAEGPRVHAAGVVSNTSDEDLGIDLGAWRLRLDDGSVVLPVGPRAEHLFRRVAARNAESIGLDFDAGPGALDAPAWLVVGGITVGQSDEPLVVGEIPLSVEPLADDVAGAPPVKAPAGVHEDQKTPSADLLRRACGSGPGVTCPR